jgi:hypothetical protein
MKAVEYVEEFKSRLGADEEPSEDKWKEVCTWLLIELMTEGQKLIETRKARRNSAIIGVLQEQNAKWLSITSKVEGLRKEGFKDYIKAKMAIDISPLASINKQAALKYTREKQI